MITANDLRIGNWFEVSLKSGSGKSLLRKIGCQDIVRIFEGIGVFNYKPILLTEEILLKCGGKPLKNGLWIPVHNLRAELHFEIFKNTDEIVTTLRSQFCELILDRIEHLHNLQNIYKELARTELIIQLQ